MNWFARNVLLTHLVVFIVVLGWIHGGTRPDLLLPVIPWVTLIMLEWLLVFPQAKRTETLVESRRRVWRALKRDPLVYTGLALLVLLIIPLFNVAYPPVFDAASQKWIAPKPPVTWLPYSVNPDHHAVLLLWFPPAIVAALAAKHGLLKRGKRLLLEAICWNGAALAVLGFVQLATDTQNLLWLTPMKSYFFSSFGYPNFAGAFFTLHTAIALGIWFQDATEVAGLAPCRISEDDERSVLFTHRLLLPAMLCFVAAVASLSRAAILLSVLVLLAMIAYILIFVWRRVSAGARVTLVSIVGAVLLAVVVVMLVFKLDKLKAEIRTITPSAVVERVTGAGYYHARIAKAIFCDHPVFGVGGWGYPRYQQMYMTAEDEKRVQREGGANVHNDSLQFLAEQGIVGYGLLVACALILAIPLVLQAWRLVRIKPPSEDGALANVPKGWLSRIPPPLIAVWLGTGATVCHSLGDLPFRTPSILAVWVLALVCVTGWLPAVRTGARNG